ncbi:MAG: hypothetical protein LBL72_10890 [Candidatus Accumulibacter sp.]|nr:hypothetical protein [Accumulibacter sp.]
MTFPENEVWKTAFEQKRGTEYLVELTQGGEKIESWTQLVTQSYRIFPKERFRALVELTVSGLRKDCPSLQTTFLKNEPFNVIYRWSDGGCGGFPAQEAIMRFDYVENGVANLQYAYYKSKANPNFDLWIKYISDAELVK